MTDQKLIEYIASCVKNGISRDAIEQELLRSGWNPADVAEGLNTACETTTPRETPPPVSISNNESDAGKVSAAFAGLSTRKKSVGIVIVAGIVFFVVVGGVAIGWSVLSMQKGDRSALSGTDEQGQKTGEISAVSPDTALAQLFDCGEDEGCFLQKLAVCEPARYYLRFDDPSGDLSFQVMQPSEEFANACDVELKIIDFFENDIDNSDQLIGQEKTCPVLTGAMLSEISEIVDFYDGDSGTVLTCRQDAQKGFKRKSLAPIASQTSSSYTTKQQASKAYMEHYNEICDYSDNPAFNVDDFENYYLVEDRSTPDDLGRTSAALYLKDNKHVYYYCRAIDGADPDTYVVLSPFYAKDKNNVYIHNGWNEVAYKINVSGVDASSFEVLNINFAKDKNHAYSFADGYAVLIEGADGSSFHLLSEGKYAGESYAEDKNNVYYYDEHEKVKVIEGADATRFSDIAGNEYFIRDDGVYYNGKMIEKADKGTFEVLESYHNGEYYYFYAKDKNNVYFMGRIIESADTGTFKALSGHDYYHYEKDKGRYESTYIPDAKDKNNCYTDYHIIQGASCDQS